MKSALLRFLISIISLQSVFAEQSPVCQQGVYAAFQGLAQNSEALRFCSQKYPLAPTTVTVQGAPSKRYARRAAPSATTSSPSVKATTSLSTTAYSQTTNKSAGKSPVTTTKISTTPSSLSKTTGSSLAQTTNKNA